MFNHKKKKIILFYIVTSLVISLAFVSISSLAYDWNETETFTLREYDNVGYGVLDGNRIRENQLLETEYGTDVRYVRQSYGQRIDTMANDSSLFRTNLASGYYNDYIRYDLEDATWRYQPTYIQAFNNTGIGPNLQFTTGVNNQGTLSLNSETAIEMEADTYYVFKVNLQGGEMYNLNMKSIDSMSYYIYYNDYLSESGSVNGITRNIQPLVARARGEYFIYLFSNNDNYVVFDPVKVSVSGINAGDFVSGDFTNEPNNIWDEERQVYVDNDNSEHVIAYYVNVPKGVYEFKYIRFDAGIDTDAYVHIPGLYYESLATPQYIDFSIGSSSVDKFLFNFEYATKVLVYITAERDNNDYVEFDYIFSVENLDCPTLQAGVPYEYEDNFLCFGIDVIETQVAYINFSSAGPLDLWFFDHKDKELVYGNYYTLWNDGADVAKILLQPGYYYFMNPFEGVYDFDLEYNAVIAESFIDNIEFALSQEDGDPSNYKLIKLDHTDFNYHNYNISLVTQYNYTVEFGYSTFLRSNDILYEYSYDYVGYQQVNGTYEEYPITDMQFLNFLSTGEESTRYILLEIRDIYNNTGYSWPNEGSAYSEPINVTLGFNNDTRTPEVFDSVNINFIEANLAESGNGTVSRSFNTAVNDVDLYMIHATVPEHTWYRIEIVIVNGTRDDNYYTLKNYDGVMQNYFYRDAVLNKYYHLDGFYSTHYINYNDSDILQVTFDIEFGVFDSNLIFMFGVDHTALNGSISFTFVPHDSTLISSFASLLTKGLGLVGIIALAVIGGGIAVAAIVLLVVKVIIPKTKSSSSPSQF